MTSLETTRAPEGTAPRHDRSPALAARTFALVSLAGLANIAAEVGHFTGSTESVLGRLIARFDVGVVVIIVAIAALVTADRLELGLRGSRFWMTAGAAIAALGVPVHVAMESRVSAGAREALGFVAGSIDTIGLALIVVSIARVGPPAALRSGKRILPVAAAIMLATAWLGGLPRGEPVTGVVDLLVRRVAYLAVAGLIVLSIHLAAGSPSRWFSRVGFAAPGSALAGSVVVGGLARQHIESYVDTPNGSIVAAAAIPLFLWSAALAVAIGVVITAAGALPVIRWRTGRWPAWWYPAVFAGVVGGGLLMRVTAWLRILATKTDDGDPLFYHVTANALAEGRGFPEPLNWLDSATPLPSALHGPLYPVILSLSSRLGGTSYVDHKFVSILIGTATVAVTMSVARRLGGRAVALVAGVFAALYPNLWMIDPLLFPEGLFALLTTSCVLLAYRWRDRPTWWCSAAIGALIGLAALTRGEGLLLAPLLVMPWMLRNYDLDLGDRWRHLVLAGATCLMVLAPWTARNLTTFEEFVPLSENGNELLVYANCDLTYSGRLVGYWAFDCQEQHRAEFGEPPGDRSEKARYWRTIGLDYAGDHLDDVPRVVAIRVARQWELFRPMQNVELSSIEGREIRSAKVGLVMYFALAASSVAGAIMLRRRRVRLLPLGAQALSVTITAAYAYGTVRFRAPMEPVLCILAAVAAVPVLSRAWKWLLPADVEPGTETGSEASGPVDDDVAYVLGGSGGLRRVAQGARRSWLSIGLILLTVALPLRGLFSTTGGTMEEGFMLYFPERMWKGDVPNVDFLHLYGPGSLYALMGWFKVVGFTLGAERAFGTLQHLAIIFALYTLARAWGRTAATAVGVLSTLLILTPIGLTAMAWNGGLALVLWSAIVALRATNRTVAQSATHHWIGAGLLGGLALTFRPDLILAVALVAGWLAWQHRAAVKPLLVGGVIGAIPMWIHLAIAGPSASFEGMFSDPVFHLRAGRELPSPPSWNSLDGSLQAIAETVPPYWPIPSLPASQSLFIWFWLMLVIAAGLVAFAIWLRHKTDGSATANVLLVGSIIGVGIVPQALQRPDSTHLAWVTCISWPLLVLAIWEVMRLHEPRSHPRRRTVTAAAVLAALMLIVAPLFTYRYYLNYARISVGDIPAAFPVERDGRKFYLGDVRPWRASAGVIEALDAEAQPGERLFVGPQDLRRTWYSDVFFYYLFPELDPATYYIEMDPGLANAPGSMLAREIETADWVILTGFWNGWIEPNSSMEFGPDEPNQVIRDQFCEVDSFENGLIVLYRRCTA